MIPVPPDDLSHLITVAIDNECRSEAQQRAMVRVARVLGPEWVREVQESWLYVPCDRCGEPVQHGNRIYGVHFHDWDCIGAEDERTFYSETASA